MQRQRRDMRQCHAWCVPGHRLLVHFPVFPHAGVFRLLLLLGRCGGSGRLSRGSGCGAPPSAGCRHLPTHGCRGWLVQHTHTGGLNGVVHGGHGAQRHPAHTRQGQLQPTQRPCPGGQRSVHPLLGLRLPQCYSPLPHAAAAQGVPVCLSVRVVPAHSHSRAS